MTFQKINNTRLFLWFFIIVSVVILVIVGIRCATIPFAYDEVTTFYYYIQSGDFLPYRAPADSNNHILNSCLSRICFNLFGDSPFSLRLPNLLALIILLIATYRISRQLIHEHAKLVLLAGFLLSFHWLSFFSLCRGYGLSMAFLILSLSFPIEYFKSKELNKLFLFYLFIQIAISANLMLEIVAMGLTISIITFQVMNKELLKKINITILPGHILLLLFWIKFSFFLQNKGAFWGTGNNYWKITFISLIELLSGTINKWIPYCILVSFLILLIVTATINFKLIKTNIRYLFNPLLFFPLMLTTLIVAIFGMKILFHINYPEDRIAMFFYVFYVLSVVFIMDYFTGIPVKILTCFIVAGMLIHFTMNINFRKHSLPMYQTIPEKFFVRLLDEQKYSNERITVGGQMGFEFMYNYLNYCHSGVLNIIDAPNNDMYMKNDYAIALTKREQYYKPYYNEIDSEKECGVNWGMVLLKRREKIKRNILISKDSLNLMQGNEEFFNLYCVRDTGFRNRNPLLVEFNIGWIQTEMPVQAWLVLQIDTSEGHNFCYKKIPLNWLKSDWSNSMDQRYCLVSDKLPLKIHSLACYLWNIEKKQIKFKMNFVKIFQLEGNDVNVILSNHK